MTGRSIEAVTWNMQPVSITESRLLEIKFTQGVIRLHTEEIYHHGILGQKWGVRRFQNKDGSLTDEGRKKYKKELKGDKFKRTSLENKAYDSGKIADLYNKKQKHINKKYEKAIEKDPKKNKEHTKEIERTKDVLDFQTNVYTAYNDMYINDLKKHVDYMINKYSDTKIKDVKTKTLKSGVEFVQSNRLMLQKSNVRYTLERTKYIDGNGDKTPIYKPVAIISR